jgi:flagellar protein FlaF
MNPYATNAHIPEEGNPRKSEAWALTEAARRMGLACRGDNAAMREALRLNWRLWTIFQADLSARLTPVEGAARVEPDQVTINMLTLCQFVDKKTVDALADPTPEKLRVLMEINWNIAAGLMESLAREAQGQASPPEDRESVSAVG